MVALFGNGYNSYMYAESLNGILVLLTFQTTATGELGWCASAATDGGEGYNNIYVPKVYLPAYMRSCGYTYYYYIRYNNNTLYGPFKVSSRSSGKKSRDIAFFFLSLSRRSPPRARSRLFSASSLHNNNKIIQLVSVFRRGVRTMQ